MSPVPYISRDTCHTAVPWQVNPNMEVTGLLVEKCKYMDSAKKPPGL